LYFKINRVDFRFGRRIEIDPKSKLITLISIIDEFYIPCAKKNAIPVTLDFLEEIRNKLLDRFKNENINNVNDNCSNIRDNHSYDLENVKLNSQNDY